MGLKTALFAEHEAAGAKMVDFGGWDMPIHYGSQVEEHNAVRTDAGVFDVSHMTVVDVTGDQAKAYLQNLLANDVDKLQTEGRALYSVMLNEQGGVIDDLIVNKTSFGYRLVVNCSTREKDLVWMEKQAANFAVTIQERDEFAMLAVQGPNAFEKLANVLPAPLLDEVKAMKPFYGICVDDMMVSRTGYTGEDGVEMVIPAQAAVALWQACLKADIRPIGLGARDTLRLEAGMNLYGNEMDEQIQPWEAGLAWTIALNEGRDFIGRSALEATKEAGVNQKLVGIVLEGKGVLRSHQAIRAIGVDAANGASPCGEVTSGTFSPTIKKGIAMARVAKDLTGACEVEMRGKWVPATIVKMPFVRNGEVKV